MRGYEKAAAAYSWLEERIGKWERRSGEEDGRSGREVMRGYWGCESKDRDQAKVGGERGNCLFSRVLSKSAMGEERNRYWYLTLSHTLSIHYHQYHFPDHLEVHSFFEPLHSQPNQPHWLYLDTLPWKWSTFGAVKNNCYSWNKKNKKQSSWLHWNFLSMKPTHTDEHVYWLESNRGRLEGLTYLTTRSSFTKISEYSFDVVFLTAAVIIISHYQLMRKSRITFETNAK